jgi:uncharacterized membrane protein
LRRSAVFKVSKVEGVADYRYRIVGIALGVLLAMLVSLYVVAPLAIIVLPLIGFLTGRKFDRRSAA